MHAWIVFVVLWFTFAFSSGGAQKIDCRTADFDSLIAGAALLPEKLLSDPGHGLALLVGIDDYNSIPLILGRNCPQRYLRIR